MEQNPSCEADSRSASQEMSPEFKEPQHSLPFSQKSVISPIVNQISATHTYNLSLPKIYLNVFLPSTPEFY
jgi:hypothetical protein